ncbi:CAMK/CAMKL protein kinase, partial [Phytophthora megakarya]
MAQPQTSPSHPNRSTQVSHCHEPDPSTPLTPRKHRPNSDAGSPTSTTAVSEASTCMTSPNFSFLIEDKSQRDGRASSAGSSDFDELRDAQVQQLPAGHKEMPHLDLEIPQALSYQGTLSPRQQSGKRYHGGYLQHRVPVAAGLLKSWKRRYFRLREHGLVCYKTQDERHSVLAQGGELTNSRQSPKAGDDAAEKRQRTSWTSRTSSGSGQLTIILKEVEITAHQTPAKTVEEL